MSKDPAFLFYPGDYLKDTQCLSEKAQVAYDRLLCEHMRNICVDITMIYVPHGMHTFFTKNLTHDEKKMLDLVLTKLEAGVQIEWVARSMAERKAYTESRSKNRASKPTKKPKDISSTYVAHMVNEDEIVNKDEDKDRKEGVEEREGIVYPYNSETFKVNWLAWRTLLRDKHEKDYFNLTAEQSALMGLNKLAKTETEAIEILQQSLRNGWKDLFKLKTDGTNKLTGTEKRDQSKQDTSDAVARHYAERLASEKGGAGI